MSPGSAIGSTSRRNRAPAIFLVLVVAALTVASYAALPAAVGNSPSVAPSHLPGTKSTPSPAKPSAIVAPRPLTAPPTTWAKPHVAFQVHGPHPGSWGGDVPPGAPMPVTAAGAGGGWVNWSQLEQRCYGVWPTRGGQAQYYQDCYGHDEPGLAPYSNLSGSGGNVTWQVQLPVDRGPTENQSNLYSAIWFGMTLNDPYAWLNQCFLELQFYPDSSWTSPTGTVNGLWVGAAVAWQIEATSGAENPCFYAALTVQGSPGSFFTMTQGDAINVTMTGWAGNPLGENLTITDTTSGQVSSLAMYNGTGNYPLDPAYATDSWSNSLWWTPGGETPVSFAFETGHAGNPSFPENNDFGGCSPGAPPPTAINPAVPCPSYDPGAWANDTFTPWEIAPPTFFNADVRSKATQVGFTQDLGGLAFIDGSDVFGSFPYTCLGHETSAYCSYPWYSYSCAEGAYNFGATDYGTSPTTVDFGKATEYGTRTTNNAAGLGYYPPANQSVPACGNATTTLLVSSGTPGGIVTFLNATVTGSFGSFNLPPGNYSIAAWAGAGYVFDHWTSSWPSCEFQNYRDSYTNLIVIGSPGPCGVGPIFVTAAAAAGQRTNVTFGSTTSGATFTLVPGEASSGFGEGPAAGTMEVTGGTTISLDAGLYTIQAQPPPAYNFTGWNSSNASAAWFSAPEFPVTVLDLPSTYGAAVYVNATFVASTSIATVIVFTADAADTVVLNGSNYSGFSVAVLPVGSYPISYVPGPGARFSTWLGGGSEILTNFSASSRVTFEAGTSTIEADDYAIQLVTLNDSGGNGTVTWNSDQNATAVAVPSGTTVPVNVSESVYPRFSLVATPGPGEAFAGWTINNTALGYFGNRLSYYTDVSFNTTGVDPVTITAHYSTGGRATVHIHIAPSAAGTLTLGFATPLGNGSSLAAATGDLFAMAQPNAGFVVAGLTADNLSTTSLVRSAGPTTTPWAPSMWILDVAGNTTLNVTFRPLTHPVTFVADWPGGLPTATINGTIVGQGDTIWLPNGTYSLSATLGSGVTFLSWTPSWSDLNVSAPGNVSTTFNVTGPGTLYALGSIPNGPIVVLAVLQPTSASLRPGGSVDLNATAVCLRGPCPSANLTFAWSVTNPAAGSLNVSTGQLVKFSAANVDATTQLIVNATLNGTTVESAPASIAVVPALTGVTLAASSHSIYAGQSIGIVTTLSCTANVTCPGGATITPSLGNVSLGFLGSNLTYAITFTSYAGESGTENISVAVSLNGVILTPVTAVEIALPLLVGVSVAPTPVSTPVGGSAMVSATAGCSDGLGCPSGVQFAWTLAPTTLGALSSSTGSTIQFTGATTAGTGTLTAAGTLNGVTISSAAVPVTVTPATVVVTLVSVTISPATLSIAVGSSGQFTAAVACSPDPCPSGVSVAWTLTGNVGTLSNSDGSSTNVSAAFAGTGSLYANGTLNGKTISAIPASVTVPSAGGSNSNSTPAYDSPLLWVAIVVIAVVLIAAYLLMRRGPSEPAPTPPAGATSTDPPK